MPCNFYELIRRTLLAQPNEVLLCWPAPPGPAVSYTGQALLDSIDSRRAQLIAQEVPAGTPVLLLLPVSVDFLTTLLAVLAQGAVPVLPPAGVRYRALPALMRQTNVGLVLLPSPPGWVLRLAARLLKVRVAHLSPDSVPAAPPPPVESVPPEQTALLTHSSGSTGPPKAIRRSHAVLRAQHDAIKTEFPPWAGQRDFPLFPNVLLHNLAAGVTSLLPEVPWADLRQLNPQRVIEQMQRERVQTLTGNVFYFQKLLSYLRRYPAPLPEVVAVGVGGSPVPEPLLHELRRYFTNATVYVIYGSSEAEPIAVRAVEAMPADPLVGYPVGALAPLLDCRIRPTGTLRYGTLRYGPGAGREVGEIEVRGPHVAGAAPDGWLRTGDFGYRRDNHLFLTGRRGNERLHQGVSHYLVEHLLQHLPGVERVAARAEAAGFTVFVQGSVSRESVLNRFGEHLPAALCLDVQFRTELPVDRRHFSKIQYGLLR